MWDQIARSISACVGISIIEQINDASPHNHFTAGPNCRVRESTLGRIDDAGGYPAIRSRIVSPAGVENVEVVIKSAPDDHFIAGPDRGMTDSYRRHVSGSCGCPSIRAGIVSPASVQRNTIYAAPDDHLTAGPHRSVESRPSGALVVLVAIQVSVPGSYLPPVLSIAEPSSTPDDHFMPVQTAV